MARYQREYNDDDHDNEDSNSGNMQDGEGGGTTPAAPMNSEEESFKKRYGDLRRHMNEVQRQKDAEIQELKEQVANAGKKQVQYPKTREEVQAWMQKYPDVAGIIETIVLSKTDERVKEVNGELSRLKQAAKQAEAEGAYKKLLAEHPDFDDLRNDPNFHAWINDQPKYIQDALYKNNTDVRAASRAIDLYKYENGLNSKKTTKRDVSRAAAESVNSRSSSTSRPNGSQRVKYSESMIEEKSRTDPNWFEKHEADIMESIRAGNFDYDISGGAR